MMICDPLGFPRWLNYNYGMEFANLPGRTLQFFEAYHTYRTIWTDGRALPKDPEPRWMGYSIGRWDGDTFIVESTGYDDRSWLDAAPVWLAPWLTSVMVLATCEVPAAVR